MRLELKRPLAVFDLETTGVDPARDKIVEFAVEIIHPDGSRKTQSRRINPERPIPPGASAVHGIYDKDVADAPVFREVAPALLEFFGDADLAGFNVARFDIPLLDREFKDCGLDFELSRRKVVDAMRIFHLQEPRDLSAAAKFYLDQTHEDAHAADADVAMTTEILLAQLKRYPELPRDVEGLANYCSFKNPDSIDEMGKFRWRDGVAVIAFGKHSGTPLQELAQRYPDYLKWIMQSDFSPCAKEVAKNALQGIFPEPEVPQST